MRTTLLFLLAAGLIPAASDRVKMSQANIKSGQVAVFANQGRIDAEIRELHLDLKSPNGKSRIADIIAVFEPATGSFWWQYETNNPAYPTGGIERFKSRSVLYLADNKLVSFSVHSPNLGIREIADHEASIDAGISKVIASVESKLPEIENGTAQWFTWVNLAVLGQEFFNLRDNAITMNQPRLSTVSFLGSVWRVRIEGPNGDSVIVSLNELYQLVGTNKVQDK